MLTIGNVRFEMSHMERGLTVVKIAHSVHEKIPENTVWRAGKRVARCHRNEPGSVCGSVWVCT